MDTDSGNGRRGCAAPVVPCDPPGSADSQAGPPLRSGARRRFVESERVGEWRRLASGCPSARSVSTAATVSPAVSALGER